MICSRSDYALVGLHCHCGVFSFRCFLCVRLVSFSCRFKTGFVYPAFVPSTFCIWCVFSVPKNTRIKYFVQHKLVIMHQIFSAGWGSTSTTSRRTFILLFFPQNLPYVCFYYAFIFSWFSRSHACCGPEKVQLCCFYATKARLSAMGGKNTQKD